MIVGVGLLVFLMSFVPTLMVQLLYARTALRLVLTSAVQTVLTLLALWALVNYAGHVALREGEASGIGVMIALTIPGLGAALVLNALVGLWLMLRIWWKGRQ